MDEPRRERSWWVYDRPLVTDWLFGWVVALSVAFSAWPYVFDAKPYRSLVALAFSFLNGLVINSILLGTGREYVRGRRQGRRAPSPRTDSRTT